MKRRICNIFVIEIKKSDSNKIVSTQTHEINVILLLDYELLLPKHIV